MRIHFEWFCSLAWVKRKLGDCFVNIGLNPEGQQNVFTVIIVSFLVFLELNEIHEVFEKTGARKHIR